MHDGAGRCDECRAAIGTGERDETREFTREVRKRCALSCVRKETDGEDAHARSRRPDSPTDGWMDEPWNECRLRSSLVSFGSFVRRGSVVRARAHDAEFSVRNEHRMQNLRRSSLSDGGASASRGLPGTPKNQRRLSVRGGTLEGERMRFRGMFVCATIGSGDLNEANGPR